MSESYFIPAIGQRYTFVLIKKKKKRQAYLLVMYVQGTLENGILRKLCDSSISPGCERA